MNEYRIHRWADNWEAQSDTLPSMTWLLDDPAGLRAAIKMEYGAEVRVMATGDFRRALARQTAAMRTDQPAQRRTEAWAHQLAAYHFAIDKPATVLDMFMGTGKSKVAIDLLQNWSGVRRVLIVCPPSVIPAWSRQFDLHALPRFDLVPLTRGSAKNAELVAKELLIPRRSRTLVFVTNIEAFWRGKFFDVLMEAQLDVLIWDELHKLKAPNGKASKRAKLLAASVPRRLGLTGTLMPHSPMDIYGQFRAIDTEIFGTTVTAFRNHYAIWEKRGNIPVPLPIRFIHQEEMRERIARITYHVGKDVLSDLPQELDVVVDIILPPGAMKIYKEVEHHFYAQIENKEVTIANGLVKILRLQQLAAGFVKTDDDVEIEVHDAKREALHDLLEGMGGEAVTVFCRFRADLAAVHSVCGRLRISSSELSGPRKELGAWQAGETQVLAVQVQSGGLGIDLTRARYQIYFTQTHAMGDYDQSRARIHRPGQTRPVTYYHFVARGTVDVKIRRALANKRKVVDEVLYGKS